MMIDAIGVAIPARDEAELIRACLRSIGAAAIVTARPVVVVVVADSCSDATAEMAALTACDVGLDLRVLQRRCGSAGAARRVAGNHAMRWLTERGWSPSATWITTTDADTTVPVDWFDRQLDWAARGVDAVAGLVELSDDAPAGLRTAFEDAVGGATTGHEHVHGANLGVRGSVLLAAGGFPDIDLGEDHALWDRLSATSARLLGVIDTTVVTSGRLRSRTVGGFATFLADLAIHGSLED